MHKVIRFAQLPQGFRPASSGLPFAAARTVANQQGKDALIVQVGERFSVYVPHADQASPEVQIAVNRLMLGKPTILARVRG